MADRNDEATDTKRDDDDEGYATRNEFDHWNEAPDPDDEAVAAAKAAAEAEENGEEAPDQQQAPEKPPADQGQSEPEAGSGNEPAEGAEGQQPQSIPYGRFKQVNDRLDAANRAIEYMRNAMFARSQSAQGGQAAPTGQAPAAQPEQHPESGQQRTPDEIIEAANAAIDEASQRFDQGEISMQEFKALERTAEDQIWEVRSAMQSAPKQAQETAGDEYVLALHASRLEESNPWLEVFERQDLEALADIARNTASRNGQPIGTGPSETMRLREMVSDLTNTYGPAWYPDAFAQTNSRPQGGASQPARSQTAQDGRRALETAAQFPPDTQQTGRAGESQEIRESDIEKMSEDEIMALPASVKARFMGT